MINASKGISGVVELKNNHLGLNSIGYFWYIR